jgi:2-amino-4-hydroxy-6-hydroxymethyldihydropteridine diphosphokinase
MIEQVCCPFHRSTIRRDYRIFCRFGKEPITGFQKVSDPFYWGSKIVILVGVGSNLPGPGFTDSVDVCEAALLALQKDGLTVFRQSPWYESAPVPASDQPWFVNGVLWLDTTLTATDLLNRLHQIEAAFGRVRREVNAPRILDLDLLDFRGEVGDGPPRLPHPRLAFRAFVLLPLRDLVPDWRHPVSRQAVSDLIQQLPLNEQPIRRLARD